MFLFGVHTSSGLNEKRIERNVVNRDRALKILRPQ